MKVPMTSAKFKVTETKKTSAKFWKDIEAGDVIQLIAVVEGQAQRARGGTFAFEVTVRNHTQGTQVRNKVNQAIANMDGFEFQEVQD